MSWINRAVGEFNNAEKNRKRVAQAAGYVFIACPDFSHTEGKYDFHTLRDGLPLSFALAQSQLSRLAETKPVRVYISDHEAYRDDNQERLKMSAETMLTLINQSLQAIREHFPTADNLSSWYPYENVLKAKKMVPQDYVGRTLVLFMTDLDLRLQAISQDSDRRKYAEVETLLKACERENLCPVFMHSDPLLGLVSRIRKTVRVPILFLDIVDPH